MISRLQVSARAGVAVGAAAVLGLGALVLPSAAVDPSPATLQVDINSNGISFPPAEASAWAKQGSTWQRVAATTKSENYSYALSLTDGTYRIRCAAAGFPTLWWGASDWAGDLGVAETATEIVVSNGAITAEGTPMSKIVCDLKAPAGRLIGYATAPNTSVQVTAWQRVNGELVARARTSALDPVGVFAFNTLAAGNYLLQFSAPGFQDRWWKSAPTAATATEVVQDSNGVEMLGETVALSPAVTTSPSPSPSSSQSPSPSPSSSPSVSTTPTPTTSPNPSSSPSSSPSASPSGSVTPNVTPSILIFVGTTPQPSASPTTGSGAALVLKSINNVIRPKIAGKPRVGRVLKATQGRWSAAKPILTYQWYVGRKLLRNATGPQLRLTKKLVGKRLKVRVTATAPGYATAFAWAKPTRKVRGQHR